MPWELVTRALGIGEGGYFRSALDGVWAALGGEAATPSRHRAAFTIAIVSLAAKMAKADGVVATIETTTFERLYTVEADQVQSLRMVFELASGDIAGFEVYAAQIRDALEDDPRLLRDVLDGLFHIAAADGVFHGKEDDFLHKVAGVFGIEDGEYRAIRAAFVSESRTGTGGVPGDDPYAVLGASPGMSDADLKAHHRQLVRDHHPDSLVARGVPPEFHRAAERKLAVINAAYDRIARERALRQPGAAMMGGRS